MAKRGILLSGVLHAGVIAAVLIYAGVPLQDIIELPPIIPVTLVTPAPAPLPQPQPSVASQVQKNLPPTQATPVARVEPPKLDIEAQSAGDLIEIEQPQPEALAEIAMPQLDIAAQAAGDPIEVEQPQPEALAKIVPPQLEIAALATPDRVVVEPEPTPDGPEPVPPPSRQSARASPPSDLPLPETRGAVSTPNRQSLTREDRELRDRLPAAIDVKREGPQLSLTLLGDVLFELSSSDLRPEARMLVAGIAAELARNPLVQINVKGHTDSSGDEDYNRILSQERANAVAAELVRSGVDPKRIHAQGFGSSQPAVPTPAGAYEPRNRRVEIILDPGA